MLLFGLTSAEHSDDDMDTAINSRIANSDCLGIDRSRSVRHSIPDTHDAELDRCIFDIAKGNSNSMAKLYSLTDKAVFGFALSILKNHHDAQDVMHDTYIRVWQYAGSYSSRSKPMAWILTITRSIALDGLRKNKYHADIDEQVGIFDENNPLMTADDRLVLQSIMQQLSSDERQIIMLHLEAGLKHREIAQILSLPLSTVLSRYNRSVKKLKKLLEVDGNEG